MTNINLLTKLVNQLEDGEFRDEILECVSALEDEIIEKNNEIDDLKKENDKLEDEIEETPSLISVDLGLDTIHYYLEKGNLNIQQQINSSFNIIQPNAILH